MPDKIIPYEERNFVDTTRSVWNYSLFNEEDIQNFRNGTHYTLYRLFGSHLLTVSGVKGFYFSVWAPNATSVFVVGDFNEWNTTTHPLFVRLDKSGIWEGFIPHIEEYENYKYYLHGFGGIKIFKGDLIDRH